MGFEARISLLFNASSERSALRRNTTGCLFTNLAFREGGMSKPGFTAYIRVCPSRTGAKGNRLPTCLARLSRGSCLDQDLQDSGDLQDCSWSQSHTEAFRPAWRQSGTGRRTLRLTRLTVSIPKLRSGSRGLTPRATGCGLVNFTFRVKVV